MMPDQTEVLKRIKTCFLQTQQTPPVRVSNVVTSLPIIDLRTISKPPESGFFAKEILSLDYVPPRPIRLLHWNVNSLQVKLDRPEFQNYLNSGDFDIICFNETKYSHDKFKRLNAQNCPLWTHDYNQYWCFSTVRKGYSGVCVLSKFRAISAVAGFGSSYLDEEGRLLTVEFTSFYVVAVYTPCSGLDCKRLEDRVEWDRLFLRHVQNLRAKKPVIILGDLNVAYSELDVFSTVKAHNFPGFYPMERKAFNDLLAQGWVDCWRQSHGLDRQYSWWDARNAAKLKGEGWRLDYCLVSREIQDRVLSAELRPDIAASDHCPLEVVFDNGVGSSN